MTINGQIIDDGIAGHVGYAWFFETIVIFGSGRELLCLLHNKKASRYGAFLGVVCGLIPADGSRILYQWLHDSPQFKKRKALRWQSHRLKMTRCQFRDFLEGQSHLLTSRDETPFRVSR